MTISSASIWKISKPSRVTGSKRSLHVDPGFAPRRMMWNPVSLGDSSMYDLYATARYFAVTGKHVAGTPVEVMAVPDAVLSRKALGRAFRGSDDLD
jgi:hypothetical protein